MKVTLHAIVPKLAHQVVLEADGVVLAQPLTVAAGTVTAEELPENAIVAEDMVT